MTNVQSDFPQWFIEEKARNDREHQESLVYARDNFPKLAQIVNPENRSLRVYYPGSGADLLTPLLTTNSDCFVYVDECTLAKGYYKDPHTVRFGEEARSLGIDDLKVDDRGNESELYFDYQHQQDTASRPRKIVFYARDAFKFCPPEIEEGYDVLITRGEAPQFVGHDISMKQLGEKLMVGGHYISDRRFAWTLLPEWIGFREIPNDVRFPCDNARVYRKVEQTSLDLLSNLFRFEEQYLDFLHFLKGGENPYSSFTQSIIERRRENGEVSDQQAEDITNKCIEKLIEKAEPKIRRTSETLGTLPKEIQNRLRQDVLPGWQHWVYGVFEGFEKDLL